MAKKIKKVTFKQAVEWASENYHTVVDSAGGIHLELADSPPPSGLALSMMKLAANNPAKFFGDIVPKVYKDETEELPEEVVKEEKKKIQTIRKDLAQFVERAKDGAK